MKIVKLYRLKKGDHFKTLDIHGEPENGVYIKDRPHTEIGKSGKRQMFATFHYAPGKFYDHVFAGYVDSDEDVQIVFD